MTRVLHPWVPGQMGRTLVEDLRYWASEYCISPALVLAAADRLEEVAQMEQTPSVGRIVHYVAYGTPGGEFPAGVCRAATITEVGFAVPGDQVVEPEGILSTVGLCVMNPTGLFFNRGIPYDPGVPRCSCGALPSAAVHTSAHPDSHDPHDVKPRYRPGTWHWPERT